MPCHGMQVRGKAEVQIAARDAIGHMDYLRERLNSSQEAIEVCDIRRQSLLSVQQDIAMSARSSASQPCLAVCCADDACGEGAMGSHAIQQSCAISAKQLPLATQVGDEALQLALEEQREQCATLEARLATTQVRVLCVIATGDAERMCRGTLGVLCGLRY